MDLLDLITRVRSNAAELDSEGFYSDADITSWLNKAQYNLAVITKHLETSTTVSITAGEGDMPNDVIEIFLVTDDTGRRMDEIALETRNLYNGYYEWEDKILIAPDDYAGDITVYYFRVPDLMVNDTDEPEVPEQHIETLVTYALYRAAQKDHLLQDAQMYHQSYTQEVQIMQEMYPKTLRRKLVRRKFGPPELQISEDG